MEGAAGVIFRKLAEGLDSLPSASGRHPQARLASQIAHHLVALARLGFSTAQTDAAWDGLGFPVSR